MIVKIRHNIFSMSYFLTPCSCKSCSKLYLNDVAFHFQKQCQTHGKFCKNSETAKNNTLYSQEIPSKKFDRVLNTPLVVQT